MLYTRNGDNGTSGLFGGCERFSKDDPIFEALGSVDELNSLLGVCYAKAKKDGGQTMYCLVAERLRAVQEDLFVAQAELAGADKKISLAQVERLEREIAEIEQGLKPITSFVIAGTTELSALLDYARAVARRVERTVVGSQKDRAVSPDTLRYINRLSSLLYALARSAAQDTDTPEDMPSY